jgi:hypothetical protein
MVLPLPKDMESLLREVLSKRTPQMLNILDSPASRMLTDEERDEIRQALTDEFCESGLYDNDEPNERGLSLEALIDKLGHI